jgi:predicted RNA-binding Zn-ribbon protein involved in translation (DUF1610 family)
MDNSVQQIPCPDCGTPISFNAMMLLQGTKFSCPKCLAQIGIAQESKPVVNEAIQELAEMKKQAMAGNKNQNKGSL